MLRSTQSLLGFSLGTPDGNVGKVKDFFFDDEAWTIRYLVVSTSVWLGRDVLISPYAVGTAHGENKVLPVAITKDQIKHSPTIDTDRPISRQYEKSYLGYYGYPNYWGSAGSWGDGDHPGTLLNGIGAGVYPGYLGFLKAPSDPEQAADPHLRSCEAVEGCHIHATDGDIGHVRGFMIDDRTWSIRYLVVNTSNWWLGHEVLLSPEWIQYVSWAESKVGIDLARQAIRDAPAYRSDAPLEREARDGARHYSLAQRGT
jgi:hypothetical protein